LRQGRWKELSFIANQLRTIVTEVTKELDLTAVDPAAVDLQLLQVTKTKSTLFTASLASNLTHTPKSHWERV